MTEFTKADYAARRVWVVGCRPCRDTAFGLI